MLAGVEPKPPAPAVAVYLGGVVVGVSSDPQLLRQAAMTVLLDLHPPAAGDVLAQARVDALKQIARSTTTTTNGGNP